MLVCNPLQGALEHDLQETSFCRDRVVWAAEIEDAVTAIVMTSAADLNQVKMSMAPCNCYESEATAGGCAMYNLKAALTQEGTPTPGEPRGPGLSREPVLT